MKSGSGWGRDCRFKVAPPFPHFYDILEGIPNATSLATTYFKLVLHVQGWVGVLRVIRARGPPSVGFCSPQTWLWYVLWVWGEPSNDWTYSARLGNADFVAICRECASLDLFG